MCFGWHYQWEKPWVGETRQAEECTPLQLRHCCLQRSLCLQRLRVDGPPVDDVRATTSTSPARQLHCVSYSMFFHDRNDTIETTLSKRHYRNDSIETTLSKRQYRNNTIARHYRNDSIETTLSKRHYQFSVPAFIVVTTSKTPQIHWLQLSFSE